MSKNVINVLKKLKDDRMSLNCMEIEEIIKNIPHEGLFTEAYGTVYPGTEKEIKGLFLINVFDGETYNHYNVSLISSASRFNLSEGFSKKLRIKTGFTDYLNSRLSGCHMIGIEQNNMLRIIDMTFKRDENVYHLLLRLWGTNSNCIVTDGEYDILECYKRYPSRDEWPGGKFIFPENKSDRAFEIRDFLKNGGINQAVEKHYYNNIIDGYFEIQKNSYLKELKKEISGLEKRLDDSLKKKDELDPSAILKTAELLKSYIYLLKPGMKNVELEDYENGQKVRVSLNPDLKPNENVENYFKKYKKSFGKKDNLLNRIYVFEKELAECRKKLELIKSADNINELESIRNSVEKNKQGDSNRNEKKTSYGREFILHDGHKAVVSRSSKEAVQLLNKYAKGNDYWFHIRDYAGSHVVVRFIKNKVLSGRSRIEAATLAYHYSKCRNADDADIYFTFVKYLHKSKGGPVGTVFPTQEKNIKLIFDKTILDEVLNRK